MMNKINKLTIVIMIGFLLPLMACSKSDADKPSQTDTDQSLKTMLHRIEPDGNNPKY